MLVEFTNYEFAVIFVCCVCYASHNLQQSNMDSKFAEQFLERVGTALHAANDDHVYLEFIRLLNDFGEKEKTADSVSQVQRDFDHRYPR